jgi:hypothetical protein
LYTGRVILASRGIAPEANGMPQAARLRQSGALDSGLQMHFDQAHVDNFVNVCISGETV